MVPLSSFEHKKGSDWAKDVLSLEIECFVVKYKIQNTRIKM